MRSSVAGCPSVTLRETSYLCRYLLHSRIDDQNEDGVVDKDKNDDDKNDEDEDGDDEDFA